MSVIQPLVCCYEPVVAFAKYWTFREIECTFTTSIETFSWTVFGSEKNQTFKLYVEKIVKDEIFDFTFEFLYFVMTLNNNKNRNEKINQSTKKTDLTFSNIYEYHDNYNNN